MATILGRKPGGAGGGGGPPSGPAGGSLAGTYPDPTLAANSVDTTQIADDSVTAAKIDDADVAAIRTLLGAPTLIQAITVGAGGAATVDFTGIADTYTHLEVWVVAQAEDASERALNVRFNNDSGANYFWQLVQGTGSTAIAGGADSDTSARITQLTATGDANATYAVIRIPFYTAGFRKIALAQSGSFWAAARRDDVDTVLWANTAAITRVTFFAASGDIKVGSVFRLYGLT